MPYRVPAPEPPVDDRCGRCGRVAGGCEHAGEWPLTKHHRVKKPAPSFLTLRGFVEFAGRLMTNLSY